MTNATGEWYLFSNSKASSLASFELGILEFKIITNEPNALRDDILTSLKHGATIVDSKGMFTGDNKSMIFCVVNIRQVPEFMKLLKKYDNLFVYSSAVSSVNGNFRWNKDDAVK